MMGITKEGHAADKDRHGRRLRGDRHPIAKLNAETAGEIKRRLKSGTETLQELADAFGVSKKTVSNIRNGLVWKWVV